MGMQTEQSIALVRSELVDAGGRFAQEFGFSRISGQILMHLYLTDGLASLDEIESALVLSKAAVSMSCTQLESLGLIVRVRVQGDRRRYYRSADNLYQALTVGIAGFVRTELMKFDAEVSSVSFLLTDSGSEGHFLRTRLDRLSKLGGKLRLFLKSPAVRLLAGLSK